MSAPQQPRPPKYQNKFAFAHNPNSKKSQVIAGIPNVGLCQRCHDIIEWRKKFRKYKPIKNLTKCACCGEKKVRSAYHLWCTDCAKGADCCPKCLQNRELVQAEAAELTQEQIQEMIVQVGMKERVRRRIWRLWENSKVTDAELREMILNYNPDAKDDPRDDEDEQAEQQQPESEEAAAARRAALAAKRGPPPKIKSAASAAPAAAAPAPAAAAAAAPAAAVSKPAAAASAAAADEGDEDGEDDEDDDDADYDDESEGDAEEEAQFQREQEAAAKKKKADATNAPAAADVEQKLAAASLADTTT